MTENHEYFTLDSQGNVQAVNIHTGESRTVTPEPNNKASSLDMNSFQKVLDYNGDVVWVPKHVSKDQLDQIQGKYKVFQYNQFLADQICAMIAEGKTLVSIAKMKGMPSYSTIAKWRREHPEFNSAYKFARSDRSEVFFHKMLEEVEQAKADKDEVALARLKAEMYKWAAKVCAPDEYVEKTQVDARVAVGTIAIETGIRRAGDPGFNIDETEALKEISLDDGIAVASTPLISAGDGSGDE